MLLYTFVFLFVPSICSATSSAIVLVKLLRCILGYLKTCLWIKWKQLLNILHSHVGLWAKEGQTISFLLSKLAIMNYNPRYILDITRDSRTCAHWFDEMPDVMTQSLHFICKSTGCFWRFHLLKIWTQLRAAPKKAANINKWLFAFEFNHIELKKNAEQSHLLLFNCALVDIKVTYICWKCG